MTFTIILSFLLEVSYAQQHSSSKRNVLLIAIDDLRPSGMAFSHPEILTPNIDKIANHGTSFHQAFCQAATCGVSRSSLLTSRRPDTTYVLSNSACPFTTSEQHKDWQSLPEYFRAFGFDTKGLGKIFHPNTCDGAAVGERVSAWSEGYYHAPCISLGSIYNGTCMEDFPGPIPEGPGGKATSIFANATASDEDMPDGMIAAKAIDALSELKRKGNPFFLAVGFHKPHLPHIAPKKYFDLYPLENIVIPDNISRHTPSGIPEISWNTCDEIRSYTDIKKTFSGFSRTNPVSEQISRKQRQAYFASASYTDAQIGKLINALDENGLANTTIIALFGDHGWHIGENNEWGKHTAMTWANRAPLLFSVPGGKKQISEAMVEFVSIYPTLADLAGITVPAPCKDNTESQISRNCTEGESLAGIINGITKTSRGAAFSQWPKSGMMGYNIFTRLSDGSVARYTEWVKTKNHTPIWSPNAPSELYNHSSDPDENYNIALDPRMTEEVTRLKKMLHTGWRGLS